MRDGETIHIFSLQTKSAAPNSTDPVRRKAVRKPLGILKILNKLD